MPRILTALLLLIGGLLGLFMTACGGVFMYFDIAARFRNRSAGFEVLPIALPSLLVGLLVLAKVAGWTKRFNQREADKQAHLAMLASQRDAASDSPDPGAGSPQ